MWGEESPGQRPETRAFHKEVVGRQRIPTATDEGVHMITWVLTEEPTEDVARAIEIVEARLGSTEEINWMAPVIGEPVQE